MLFRFFALAVAISFVINLAPAVYAENPYESYTYWSDVDSTGKAVYNRPMYNVGFALDATFLGINDFTKINDVCTDSNGNVYILDSESRIVILNSDYKAVGEIGIINGTESYNGAKSIYVSADNTIYICDTEGHRILHITREGILLDTIVLPDSPLIPDNFDFRPTRVVVDTYGHLYALSDGSFYGALLYAPDKSFLGFYGANVVTTSISDVLTNIKNRVLPNNVKKGNTAQRLPYVFVGIDIDKEGFVYTCNGFTKNYSNSGQIRKLSPGTGSNILASTGVNFADSKVNRTFKNGAMAKQDILDIAVDSNGFIYGLESAFGKVFMYDDNCRTLTVFGGGMGQGSQLGNFVTVSGLALNKDGGEVLISDSATNKITVFELTDYGKLVKGLVSLTLEGNYLEAKSGWEEVLKLDNNFQPALSGLARAYLSEGDYSTAMKLAKKGYDRETYGLAFEYARKDFIDNNFMVLFIALITVIIAAIAFLVISTKKRLVLIKNKQLNLMFSTMIHPTVTFTDVKEKKLGSIPLCIATIAIFYVATILQTLAGGFLFSNYNAASFNSLWVLVRSVGLVVLWVAADWMVCTLMGGKGKLREIVIVTCYSLWPLIFGKFIHILLTNVLLPTEAGFLSILDTIALLYFLLLLIIGLLRIHDFSMTRLVATSALAIVGIAAIVFLIIMITILIQQFYGFILTVASEIMTL